MKGNAKRTKLIEQNKKGAASSFNQNNRCLKLAFMKTIDAPHHTAGQGGASFLARWQF
jgi:hypothetical protein